MAVPAGVVTSLEASSLRTLFVCGVVGILLFAASTVSDKSGAEQATWGLTSSPEDVSLAGDRRPSFGFRSATCSISWRLVLLSNHQCGVGQRRTTMLVATTTSADLAGSRSRWLLQHGLVVVSCEGEAT
jgi:hypothetical protein